MSSVCQECKAPVSKVPTVVEYQGEEIYLFNPIICKPCLHRLCELHSTQCANCGGCIPPYSQVGGTCPVDSWKLSTAVSSPDF